MDPIKIATLDGDIRTVRQAARLAMVEAKSAVAEFLKLSSPELEKAGIEGMSEKTRSDLRSFLRDYEVLRMRLEGIVRESAFLSGDRPVVEYLEKSVPSHQYDSLVASV